MHPFPFEYVRPESLNEALELLGRHGEEARPLAGGQSLLPHLKLRVVMPQVVVDIGRLAELQRLGNEDGRLRIGALTRHAEMERRAWPGSLAILGDAARVIADPAVRNWGTVGGALAYADPSGDWAPVMLALRASLRCQSHGHERQVEATDFFADSYTTALTPLELLTEVTVTVPQGPCTGAYVKLERRPGDFAIGSVAVQVRWSEGNVCEEAGIGLGGLGPKPHNAADAEAFLGGKALEDSVIDEAAQLVREATSPSADIRGSAEYKREMARVLFRRAMHVVRQRHSPTGQSHLGIR